MSHQVSKILLSILANLNNAVVWIVSIWHLTFNSASLFPKPLKTIPSESTTISITVTFMCHNLFSCQARSKYLFIFSYSFIFPLESVGKAKSTIWQIMFSSLYYFTPWEFFTSTLTDGFLLEFEWEKVSSNLLDSSQYSGRSQQCGSLDSLRLARYFQVLQSLYQPFSDCTQSTNYNWYSRHFRVPQIIIIIIIIINIIIIVVYSAVMTYLDGHHLEEKVGRFRRIESGKKLLPWTPVLGLLLCLSVPMKKMMDSLFILSSRPLLTISVLIDLSQSWGSLRPGRPH